ncbi:MAG: tRNA (N(6)-L-threonylcarbamoyladenosine(37)-C(2))-methylthiotransferase MtaB [Oscillospiraceae bacterium]|nr:tRNA (N(6)-L-threonylcarbamoyladenosine(37)-C(2))-methylthiotransferase MtaB [Oscillospiraceae bacterium]
MKFCTTTLGCKVNQVETEAVESVLISSGHTLAAAGDGCDVCVINTCAVTSESVRKSRQAVRRMRRLEPNALIAVCGCLSQLEADEVRALDADIIGGSGDRVGFAREIERRILEKCGEDAYAADNPFERGEFEVLPLGGSSGRTRAFLKIEDGCENFCAYCIIPYARGKVRSLPIGQAVEQAAELCGQGFGEIVITGIEITSYGKDLAPKLTVMDAIREISKVTAGARLRLGSLEPGVLTDGFCKELAAVSNLCDHFHLSLQSGCDATLRRMGRKYSAGAVLSSISLIRDLFPNCGITADLIVGFPGETQGEFTQTLDFIRAAEFSGMHIFPFSERPGTRAAKMPEQVKKAVRAERARIAKEVANEMAAEFAESQVGKNLKVLFERERDGLWIGHSSNYMEVAAEGTDLKASVRTVRVTGRDGDMLIGDVL